MKNYDEYAKNIRSKAKKIRMRRRIAMSCAGVLVLALVLTLFIPYNTDLPNVDRYQNSPYYKLIPGLNKVTYQPPEYKNNYEWLKELFTGKKLFSPAGESFDLMEAPTAMPETALNGAPSYGVMTPDNVTTGGSNQVYEEVTDNQVQGVVESDIFKRSDKYIYYLRSNVLTVYSIDKENSREISSVELPMEKGTYALYNFEMFLSQDCTTLTVLSRQSGGELSTCTVIYSLDVTDPTNIIMQEPLYFKGNYISSRMVDGALLLIYNYRVTGEIDFDQPETFVPVYGTIDNMIPLAAEDIYCPVEEPTAARYTVVAKLDSKTLQIQDTAALLSYSDEVYVSKTAIYATYGCTRSVLEGENTVETAQTEITGISYSGDTLEIMGTVTVDGRVKNQYSMDEYNGFLRLATSTSVVTRQEGTDQNLSWVRVVDQKQNCSLYCVDLRSWKVASSVLDFAPEGEEVTSARFDGDMAYVCTAEVIIMTDPVYYFDLSDIHNITYKHTPVIDGFSSSLINFGDYLLGIGFNQFRQLKLEAYEETQDGVRPIASFERDVWFSDEYKSYYIDRENNFVGIAVGDSSKVTNYLLLYFDGYEFHVVRQIPISVSYVQNCRADIIDGYLYLLESTLKVVKIY